VTQTGELQRDVAADEAAATENQMVSIPYLDRDLTLQQHLLSAAVRQGFNDHGFHFGEQHGHCSASCEESLSRSR
jgi:hypothetical protein